MYYIIYYNYMCILLCYCMLLVCIYIYIYYTINMLLYAGGARREGRGARAGAGGIQYSLVCYNPGIYCTDTCV